MPTGLNLEFIDKAIDKHGSRAVLMAIVGMVLISQVDNADASLSWWLQLLLKAVPCLCIAAIAVYGIHCRTELDRNGSSIQKVQDK